MDLFEYWESVILETLESDRHISKRTHLAYTPLNLSIPYSTWGQGLNIGWEDINYQEGRKVQNLTRWYYPEGLKEVLTSGINRSNKKYASISASMVGLDKNVRGSQGHCIQTITATRHYKQIHFSLFYRSVDLCRAWLADLKFLSEIVIPQISEDMVGEIEQVSFHFSNANIEAITGIHYLIKSRNHLQFLELLDSRDPSTLSTLLRFIYPLYSDSGAYTQLKRAFRQQLFWEDNIKNKPDLEKAIKQLFFKYKLTRKKP